MIGWDIPITAPPAPMERFVYGSSDHGTFKGCSHVTRCRGRGLTKGVIGCAYEYGWGRVGY